MVGVSAVALISLKLPGRDIASLRDNSPGLLLHDDLQYSWQHWTQRKPHRCCRLLLAGRRWLLHPAKMESFAPNNYLGGRISSMFRANGEVHLLHSTATKSNFVEALRKHCRSVAGTSRTHCGSSTVSSGSEANCSNSWAEVRAGKVGHSGVNSQHSHRHHCQNHAAASGDRARGSRRS